MFKNRSKGGNARFTPNVFKSASVLLVTLSLVACGGNNHSASGGDPVAVSPTVTRTLIDAPIDGVSYECGDLSGVTQNGGQFDCKTAPVEFSLGALILGSIDTFNDDDRVFPQDFSGVGRDNFSDVTMLKLARLFQSLDDDGNIENTITIPAATAAKFTAGVSLSDSLESLARIAGVDLVSKAFAVSHLRRTLTDSEDVEGYSVQIELVSTTKEAIANDVVLIIRGVEVLNSNKEYVNAITLLASAEKTATLLLRNIPESDQDLKLIVKAEGYLDTGTSIILSEDQKSYVVSLDLVKDMEGLVTNGVFTSRMDVASAIDVDGKVTQEIVLESKQDATKPRVKITIPEGTVLTDRQGNPVAGATLKVTGFDPYEEEALAAYPGGLNVIANASGFEIDGVIQEGDREINFKSAGFAAISITDENGKRVKDFSQNIEVAMQFKEGTEDGDGNVVVIGDSVPIWSYDEDTGKWDYEQEGIVSDLDVNDGLFDVVYQVNHLSYWNLDWYYGGVCNPRFNFSLAQASVSSPFRELDYRLTVNAIPPINRSITNYANDDFLEFLRAPAGYSGSLEVRQDGVVVGLADFGDLCDGGAGRSFDVLLSLKVERDIDAGATVNKTFGDAPFINAAPTYADTTDTYESSDTGVLAVDNTGLVTIVGAGTAVITRNNSGNAQFFPDSDSYNVIISRANTTVNAGVDQIKTFGEAAFNQSAGGVLGDGVLSLSSSNTGVAVVDNNGLVTIIGAGETVIEMEVHLSDNYFGSIDSYTLQVNKGVAAINIGGDVSKVFGSGSFTRTATQNSNTFVSYTSSNAAVATITLRSGVVTLLGAGSAIISASTSETDNFIGGSDSFTLTVEKAVASVNAGDDLGLASNLSVFRQTAFANPSSNIEYGSSDETIATVDATGELSLTGKLGYATITASVAASANYQAVSDSYQLSVRPVLTANASDTTIDLSWTSVVSAQSYNLYYATESFALLDGVSNYASLAGSGVITDLAATSHTLSNLTNDVLYYFVLTAVIDSVENDVTSNEVTATQHVLQDGYVFAGSEGGSNGVPFDLEPWVTDGTVAGTRRIANINESESSINYSGFVRFNDEVYFAASNGDNDNQQTLWKTDGSEQGTSKVPNIGGDYSFVNVAAALPGYLFFSAQKTGEDNHRTFSIDASNGITPLEQTIGDNRAQFGDSLIFSASLSVEPYGSVAFITDGLTVAAIQNGAEHIEAPIRLKNIAGKLFYFNTDINGVFQLWAANADGSSPVALATFTNLGSSSFSDADTAQQMVEFNGKLYFSADDALWVSDGTIAGTVSIMSLGNANEGDAIGLNVVAGKLIFQVTFGTQKGLWVSDGTASGTVQISDIATGGFFSSTGGVLLPPVVNGLYFYSAGGDEELMASDGTVAGTYRVKDINPAGSSSPSGFIPRDGYILFYAFDNNDSGLWRSDGTEAGTFLLKGGEGF